MDTFDYFYGNEAEQYAFFRIPKLLFVNPVFAQLSDSAKIMYGLFLDRVSLSRKNNWVDDQNRAYVIFSHESIREQLNCSKDKATKTLSELDSKKGIGLIERIRIGLGKPDIIYVKNFSALLETPENRTSVQSPEKQDSGVLKNRILKSQKAGFKSPKKQDSHYE